MKKGLIAILMLICALSAQGLETPQQSEVNAETASLEQSIDRIQAQVGSWLSMVGIKPETIKNLADRFKAKIEELKGLAVTDPRVKGLVDEIQKASTDLKTQTDKLK